MRTTIRHGWMSRWMAAWGNVPVPGCVVGQEIGPPGAVASGTGSLSTTPPPGEAADSAQRGSTRHSTRWTLAAFR